MAKCSGKIGNLQIAIAKDETNFRNIFLLIALAHLSAGNH
jgi:hypothetical protein